MKNNLRLFCKIILANFGKPHKQTHSRFTCGQTKLGSTRHSCNFVSGRPKLERDKYFASTLQEMKKQFLVLPKKNTATNIILSLYVSLLCSPLLRTHIHIFLSLFHSYVNTQRYNGKLTLERKKPLFLSEI